MSFSQVGDFKVQIVRAIVAESTLNKKPGSFDVCLEVVTEDGAQSDWYRMNVSTDYSRIKGKENWTQAQVTFEKLQELGYQGQDFTRLDTLVGTVTTAHVEKSDCGRYHNIRWLGTGRSAPTAVDPSVLQQMGSMLQGGQPQGQAQPAQPAQGSFGGGGFGQPAQPAAGGFAPPANNAPAPGGFGGGGFGGNGGFSS